MARHLPVAARDVRAAVAALGAVAIAIGCGGGDRTGEDQPGAGADGYELVIVDGDTASADSVAAATAAAAADTGGVVRFVPDGAFTVQVGMYTDAGQAAAEVQKLADSGYPAYAVARPDGRGVRVRVGYFATREEADRFGRRFAQDTGAEFWVDRRANEAD